MTTNKHNAFFVDSSVLLRAIVDSSYSAAAWFQSTAAKGAQFVGSRLLEVEVRRIVRNIGADQSIVSEYLDEFTLLTIDNALLDEAIAIPHRLGGADSIHVASALRVGQRTVTLVTHDAQMAAAANALGFSVLDPVSDDPKRAPVAPSL